MFSWELLSVTTLFSWSCGIYFQAGSWANQSRSSLKSCQLRCASAGAPNPTKLQLRFQHPEIFGSLGITASIFACYWTQTHLLFISSSPLVNVSLVFQAWGRAGGSLHHWEKSQTSWRGSGSRAAHPAAGMPGIYHIPWASSISHS